MLSTIQGDSQLVRSSQAEVSPSGTPRLAGAGNRTSNLPVTSQPTLPPEPHTSHNHCPHSTWAVMLMMSIIERKTTTRRLHRDKPREYQTRGRATIEAQSLAPDQTNKQTPGRRETGPETH